MQDTMGVGLRSKRLADRAALGSTTECDGDDDEREEKEEEEEEKDVDALAVSLTLASPALTAPRSTRVRLVL